MPRDDFDPKTKETLAKRVGMKCSYCGRGTTGPQEDSTKSVNVGVAAHITAASPGGKRFDTTLTSEQRSSIDNGIWLCQTCAKLIDDDEARFSVDSLKTLKLTAEAKASAAIITAHNAHVTRDIPSVRMRISPTRMGWRQLAHFQLFNPGPRPVRIDAWFSTWGKEGNRAANEAVDTLDKGRLPKRLEDQEGFNFTVAIDDYPIEALNSLGVVDGNGHRWSANPEEIATFISSAIAHRPPGNRPKPQLPDADPAKLNISVERSRTAVNGEVLEIVFQNNSSVAIPLRGAEIRWKYNPPRESATSPGRPTVAETEGSIRVGFPRPVVDPNCTYRYVVPKDMSAVLVATLASDVGDNDIEVVIVSTAGGWMEKGPHISKPIRDYAQHIVDSWEQ